MSSLITEAHKKCSAAPSAEKVMFSFFNPRMASCKFPAEVIHSKHQNILRVSEAESHASPLAKSNAGCIIMPLSTRPCAE